MRHEGTVEGLDETSRSMREQGSTALRSPSGLRLSLPQLDIPNTKPSLGRRRGTSAARQILETQVSPLDHLNDELISGHIVLDAAIVVVDHVQSGHRSC